MKQQKIVKSDEKILIKLTGAGTALVILETLKQAVRDRRLCRTSLMVLSSIAGKMVDTRDHHGNPAIAVQITRNKFADDLGVTVKTVSNYLAQLRALGYIATVNLSEADGVPKGGSYHVMSHYDRDDVLNGIKAFTDSLKGERNSIVDADFGETDFPIGREVPKKFPAGREVQNDEFPTGREVQIKKFPAGREQTDEFPTGRELLPESSLPAGNNRGESSLPYLPTYIISENVQSQNTGQAGNSDSANSEIERACRKVGSKLDQAKIDCLKLVSELPKDDRAELFGRPVVTEAKMQAAIKIYSIIIKAIMAERSISGLSCARDLNCSRKGRLKAILEEFTLEDWIEALFNINNSKLCLGLKAATNGYNKSWRVDIDWVLRPREENKGSKAMSNFVKLLEDRMADQEDYEDPPIKNAPDDPNMPALIDNGDGTFTGRMY